VRADVEAIERTIAHATDLIGDLVAFSRPTERSSAVVCLDDELRALQPSIADVADRSVQLTLELGAPAVRVSMEPAPLHRVVLNLCANANDAMPDGGMLTLRSGVVWMDVQRRPSELSTQQLPDGSYVEVVVADTGAGIDRTVISKVFEPYFTTKPPGRGTGLGLATVYSAVVQCGGAIHVESAPGQGATFTIWLPVEARGGPIGRST
jgi:two-component system cell cycle sensor histidine kinase/response regulator CckA